MVAEPVNDEPLEAQLASTPTEGDNKYHFFYAREDEEKGRIEYIHLSAGFGETPEEALDELLANFRAHGHMRPVEEWNRSKNTKWVKEDESGEFLNAY